MMDFLSKLFDTEGFRPRWICGVWTPTHGWLHILSDLGVWSAYIAIPCVLGYFVWRRKDIPFRTLFLLFGAFILACGTTHLMEAIIFWWPAYRLAGLIKLFTAVVSWATVLALVPVAPKVLAMRTPEELEREIAARKEAEQKMIQANAELERQIDALRSGEERFRLLVEGTKDYAIFMLDPTGQVVSWNAGAERINQYKAEEIVGQHFSRFYPAEDVQAGKPPRELQIAVAEGRYEEEGWRVRKDGSHFWSSVVITALRDAGGTLRGFGKVTRDMSERKTAEENARRLLQEEAARKAAEQYAQIIEAQRKELQVTLASIGDGVITTDAQGRITLLNPVAEALTGWKDDEAKGQPLHQVFTITNELTRAPAENPVDKVLREGRVVGLANHTVLTSKNGTERPIDDSAAPIKNECGATTGVVLVFRDVTQQREIEEAHRRHREVLKLVHKVGKIGHWEWNAQTDENIWSPEIEGLYGLPPGGFEGGYDGWTKLLHPDDLAQAEADVRRAMETGGYFTEFRVIWPSDRSVHWLETRAMVFKDESGKPLRMVGVNMDVTERKQVEEELRQSQRELQQRIGQLAEADRHKNEFLATLAHELRNPLAPIRNAVELLRHAQGDPAILEQARSIMARQLEQMVHLIDDLLDMSRISRGKVQLRRQHVALTDVVQSAVESARPLIDAQAHELTVTMPSETIVLDADATRLAQVISNLLNNAAKYMEKGGHIWLTVENIPDEISVSVRDTGIGIAAEHLPHIFEMFSQVTPALDRSQGGLGIGLALVRALVELHGGRIEARSAGVGKGSEFRFHLPFAERVPQAQEATLPAPATHAPGGPKCSVLIVDDNRDSAKSLAMMLGLLGHQTFIAFDGLEALHTAANSRPNVVLLDIGLPKMNGYDVARAIRKEAWGKSIHLVALTGWGQEEDKQQAFDAGFDEHLTKPVAAAVLEKLLAEKCP